MKRIIRLTEQELKRIMRESVKKALLNKAIVNEHIDREHEIVLAQKTLIKMSPLISELGMRLEGTKYYSQFQRVYDAIEKLNNSLIHHIRRENEFIR